MTSVLAAGKTAALRRAAVRATRAPSIHNTQPWRLRLRPEELCLYADRSRQLHVLDPTSRQLIISCGCALLNARVSLASQGLGTTVHRFPDPDQPDLLARLTLSERPNPDEHHLAALDNVIELRQTNRRRFADHDVPTEILANLQHAASTEDSTLFIVHHQDHRHAVANLSQKADDIENLNPAYRAELRAWTSNDPRRTDGVPALAVPHVDGTAHDDIPVRDFDTHGTGWLPTNTQSTHRQCLALICTDTDTPTSWLRAGEALERVLLEITRHGFVASPLTQVTEIPTARAQLRQQLNLTTYPHVLLRIGRAPLTPASPRRHMTEVLTEELS